MPSGQFGFLTMVNPDRSLRQVPIDGTEFTIGQDPRCHLALGGADVGAQHAVIRIAGTQPYLVALQPTWVNGTPAQQHPLQPGDVITIAGMNIVYRVAQAAPPSAPAPPASAAAPPPWAKRPGMHRLAAPGTPTSPPPGMTPHPPAAGAPPAPSWQGGSAPTSAPPSWQGGSPPTSAPPSWQGAPPPQSHAPSAPPGAAWSGTPQGSWSGAPSAPPSVPQAGASWPAAPPPASTPPPSWPAQAPPHSAAPPAASIPPVMSPPASPPHLRTPPSPGGPRPSGESAGAVNVVQMESSAQPMLHMVTGPVSRTVLAQHLRIGRAPDNQIVLDHVQVSRYHAEIQKRGDVYCIFDNGSTNGTFLNGQRLEGPVKLKPGDRIRISVFNLLFDGQQVQHYSEEGSARIDALQLRREVGSKVILQDISLSILPREFVAVVGVSGAGKSTLMNALSGFRPADRGVVLLNGSDYYRNFDEFRSSLGYVPQDDIIHKELTVYRALHYAAHLRMPEDLSNQEIAKRVDEVLHDLRLTEHQKTPVSRLSGGQRKRVSIGVELLTRPRLFFLDEPTSGLDPGTETEMMKLFRDLANKGHTLILVTHATKNINLCDKVVFLAKGGHLAFYGSPADALKYFKAEDFTDIYTLLDDPAKSPQQWDIEYKQSVYWQQNVVARLNDVAALVKQASQPEPVAAPQGKKANQAPRVSAFRQFRLLTQRYVEIMARDQGNLLLLVGSALLVAGLFFVFGADTLQHFDLQRFDLPPVAKGATKIDDIGKLAFNARLTTFLATIAVIFFGINNAIREIVKELPIYRRERTVNLRIVPYVMSKVVVLALICAVQTVILEGMILLHFKVPNPTHEMYIKLGVVLFAGSLAAMGMGLAFSALLSNENKTASVLPILILPQIFLTGKLPELKAPLSMITWCGLSKWPFECLGNIFQIWKIFPTRDQVNNPVLMGPLQKAQEAGMSYFKDLDIDYWSHICIMGAFFLLFILLTCVLQARKDKIRE